jgi:hypothetical protein
MLVVFAVLMLGSYCVPLGPCICICEPLDEAPRRPALSQLQQRTIYRSTVRHICINVHSEEMWVLALPCRP